MGMVINVDVCFGDSMVAKWTTETFYGVAKWTTETFYGVEKMAHALHDPIPGSRSKQKQNILSVTISS